MYYSSFEQDIEKLWIYKLNSSFYKSNKLVSKYLHHLSLKYPNFKISGMTKTLGLWEADSRTISLSLNLLRNYEWGAVEHVLKHEMAHMIVSEIFNMRQYGYSHDEAFKKACDVLEIAAERCTSFSYLSSYKSSESDSITEKIQKLFIKGNCQSLNKEEAELFLHKAQELMMKYNISIRDINGNDKLFVTRPIGSIYKKMPNYVNTICSILREHYFVKTIIIPKSAPFRVSKRNYVWSIELFGDKNNVDTAEYIFHALIVNGEHLWKAFSKERKAEGERIRGEYSKASFLEGVYTGYQRQCEETQEHLEKKGMDFTSLVYLKDPIVEEMYHKQYPHLKNSHSYNYARSGGYGAGVAKGLNLRIARGVGAASNNGKFLR